MGAEIVLLTIALLLISVLRFLSRIHYLLGMAASALWVAHHSGGLRWIHAMEHLLGIMG